MSGQSVILGQGYEELAARELAALGYEILARNVRMGRGELDIIAQKSGRIYFIEVKARKAGSRVSALEAVTADKRRRLMSAAEAWLHKQGLDDADCGFMLVAIENADLPERRFSFIEDFLMW